jgi:hypothetical protein
MTNETKNNDNNTYIFMEFLYVFLHFLLYLSFIVPQHLVAGCTGSTRQSREISHSVPPAGNLPPSLLPRARVLLVRPVEDDPVEATGDGASPGTRRSTGPAPPPSPMREYVKKPNLFIN